MANDIWVKKYKEIVGGGGRQQKAYDEVVGGDLRMFNIECDLAQDRVQWKFSIKSLKIF